MQPDGLRPSIVPELRKAATLPVEPPRDRLVRRISSVTEAIADGHAGLALKPQKAVELKRKQGELGRLLKNPPRLPAENKDELAKLELLEKEKQEFESQIVSLAEQETAVNTIEAKFEVLKDDLESFNKEIAEQLG